MNTFSTDQIVGDILARWPQTAQVLLQHRMFCVGCSLNRFDTLAEAAAIYGVDLEPLVVQLRTAINATETTA